MLNKKDNFYTVCLISTLLENVLTLIDTKHNFVLHNIANWIIKKSNNYIFNIFLNKGKHQAGVIISLIQFLVENFF